MSITDCTICGKPLDGVVTPDGPIDGTSNGYAHGGCYVARQFRRQRITAREKACGDCASCEQGHPERCKGSK